MQPSAQEQSQDEGENAVFDALLAHAVASLQPQDLHKWLGHRDTGGTTPMQYCLFRLGPACLQKLAQAGAHVNDMDSQGVPCLYAACRVCVLADAPPPFSTSF